MKGIKKIGIAADHAGYEKKEVVKKYLESKGYEVKDFGTNSSDSVDYADFAHTVQHTVAKQTTQKALELTA